MAHRTEHGITFFPYQTVSEFFEDGGFEEDADLDPDYVDSQTHDEEPAEIMLDLDRTSWDEYGFRQAMEDLAEQEHAERWERAARMAEALGHEVREDMSAAYLERLEGMGYVLAMDPEEVERWMEQA